VFGAGDHAAGAFGALAHAALVAQVGVGELADPGADDQVGLGFDLVDEGLALLVESDCRHGAVPAGLAARPHE